MKTAALCGNFVSWLCCDFLQYDKYCCETAPRQYAKFARKSLLFHYVVLPEKNYQSGPLHLQQTALRRRRIIPSVDKGKHGFDGQKCAHTASSPLAIRQVSPAGLFLSGHISAPTKLLAPASDVFSSDFWLLRRSWADAQQGEKGKKRRKDTLSGVFVLVNRW